MCVKNCCKKAKNVCKKIGVKKQKICVKNWRKNLV